MAIKRQDSRAWALVDSNVLLDVFENDTQWFEWSVTQLDCYARSHRLFINPVIYAEISIGFEKIEEVDAAVTKAGLKVSPIPRPALFRAGKAFLQYRHNQRTKRSPLPDFFIGAHALVSGAVLITRDATRYRSYFPGLNLIAPGST